MWQGQRVSYHTEVNLGIVIHRHIDFLLGFRWTPVVRWWMVVRNDFHGLLYQLMSFFFKSFAVSIFASVDTTTEVVVLRRWGRRSGSLKLVEVI